jgi:serine/threonine protein kinase/Tol biopolymer transport system component
MGEVYQAHDTKLGRDVAIKLLPEQFARNPERLARFQREAKLLAALNHPNIATIFGMEQSGETHYLVMELVAGETLRDRILRDGALPIAESLTIAKQIAEALEAAHNSDKGIIHRDLKPANVKVTPEGRVKVLDFGLAKAFTVESSPGDIANSPTLSALPTQLGVIMGTAAYMSPEQARGKSLDRRTDIWSFGCVLYEMLTGRPVFSGHSTADILAAVVRGEPAWQSIPTGTPPAVQAMLRRCLQSDVNRRARDAGDLRLELEDLIATPHAIAPESSPGSHRAVSLWSIAGVVLTAALIIAVALWLIRPSVPPAQMVRFAFAPSQQQTLVTLYSSPAVSPDGREIAFSGGETPEKSTIWIRSLDTPTPRQLSGTEGAYGTFWAPDSKSLGFFAEGKLKRISAGGGPVQTLCPAPQGIGGTWGPDNTIVFTPVNRAPLFRVSAAGGTPEAITSLDDSRKQNSNRFPLFLPDGKHFLFTARSDVKENTGIYVGSLDSKDVKWLFSAQSSAVYSPPGYILYVQDENLMARRFDAGSLALTGEPFALTGGVMWNATSASASLSVAVSGSVMAYINSSPIEEQLSWFDRAGNKLQSLGEAQRFREGLRLSPDNKRVAVVIPDQESGNRDIWLMDLSGGGKTRLTTNPANDWFPEWSPDGSEIAFESDRDGKPSLYRKTASSTEPEKLIARSVNPGANADPTSWSADGRFLALQAFAAPSRLDQDIWLLPLAGDGKPIPVVQTQFNEQVPALSPDGKLVAFMSNESGSNEIYIRQLDKPAQQRVSTAGGMLPRWSRDGRELFFMQGAAMMSVSVTPGDPPSIRPPAKLFDACAPPATTYDYHYDVANDEKRFLIRCPVPRKTPLQVNVWVNWIEGVGRNSAAALK